MKRFLVLIILSLFSLSLYSQANLTTEKKSDTTVVDSVKQKPKLIAYAGAIAASRNYARGVNFGVGPSFQPYAGLSIAGVTFEIFGALSFNGKYNYGTTHDISLSYEYKGFKIGVHDYFFFNKADTTHNYFFETGDPSMDGHYYEVQASYEHKWFSVLAGYNFHNTNLKIEDKYWTGVYLEVKGNIIYGLSAIVGAITGPSYLNFYDKAGIAIVGIEWNRKINLGKKFFTILDVKFHVNPNYKNISAGVQRAPVNIFASFTF